jgi:hypothetical protein
VVLAALGGGIPVRGITELTQHAGGQLWAKPGPAQVNPGGGMVAKGHTPSEIPAREIPTPGICWLNAAMSCVSATTVAAQAPVSSG